MLICMSGRYIEQELALHYGRLPPCFLPIGGERLLFLQARALCKGERSILTLPSDFELPGDERQAIEGAGFEIFWADPQLGLTAAITEVLKHLDVTEPIRLLFGDTLVELEEQQDDISDFVVVKPTRIDYPWTYGDQSGDKTHFYEHGTHQLQKTRVVCGYFSFSDFGLLREAFRQPSLYEALNFYSAERQLTLVDAKKWYDFGHLALFYQSKRNLLVTRAFNSLDADEFVITKTSHQTAKMQAEATWFETLPQKIVLHTPRYIGRKNKDHKAGYQLEYLHLPTLSDMAVFGRLPQTSMSLILSRCVQLIDTFRGLRPDANAPEASSEYAARFYDEVFQRKTWERLESFCDGFGCEMGSEFVLNGTQLPPLNTIVADMLARVPETRPEDICFWHGDYFFGNLFFDFNTQRVIMVDPRGMLFDNVLTQYGDYRYDLGKLAHSVLGGYDHIIASQARIARPGPLELEFHLSGYDENAHRVASEQLCQLVEVKFGIDGPTLHALAAVMFFSMLPLHKESPNRQAALLANGLQLFMNLRD